MSKKYTFDIATDFPNSAVFLPTYKQEILASSIAATLEFVAADGGDALVQFDAELSGEEYQDLLDVNAAHTGVKSAVYGYRAPSNLLIGTMEITQDTTWQEVNGTVTNLAAFCTSADKAWGRCVGEAKVVGEGAQLRLIRECDGESCMAAPHEMDDGGVWQKFQFWAYQNQVDGHERYVLQARKNGVTSFFLRDIAISILEKER